jgi:hypothetical protein
MREAVMIYAERTTVSVDQTRAEIERTLKRYGPQRLLPHLGDGRVS